MVKSAPLKGPLKPNSHRDLLVTLKNGSHQRYRKLVRKMILKNLSKNEKTIVMVMVKISNKCNK